MAKKNAAQIMSSTLAIVHQAADPCDDCDPGLKATVIVYSCGSTETDGIDIETELGDLFNPTRKEQFCQYVADKVKQARSKIPSDDENTLREVRDAIIPYC